MKRFWGVFLFGSFLAVVASGAQGSASVTIGPHQYRLVTNPFNQSVNSLTAVLPDVPVGTQVVQLENHGMVIYIKRKPIWVGPFADAVRLDPGKGFFLRNMADTPITVTFTGEIPASPVTTQIVPGLNLLGSAFAQTGLAETDLGLPASDGDKLFQLAPSGVYWGMTRRRANWGAAEPRLGVAEGFWYFSSSPKVWVQNPPTTN